MTHSVSLGNVQRTPKYSICIINMNTEDTLEASMRSVLPQLNNEFEVVIVDESDDNSREILIQLQKEFPIVKNVFLDKNKKRTIGDARNISIQEAQGEYCIMHIDCDDQWHPYITEFVKVFESLEKITGKDILLAGHQINIAKKSFLLSHGPYRSVEHGEDRDLWMRLAKLGLYQPIDHVPFFYRMDIGKRKAKKKVFLRTYWSVRDEIRGGVKLKTYINQIFQKNLVLNMKARVLRVFFYPFARLSSKSRPQLSSAGFFSNPEDWNEYKLKNGGLYNDIVKRHNGSEELSFLTPAGKWIFSNKRAEATILDLPKTIKEDADKS
jgi:glycosyltransferase involved in cell wall biosynthesis